MDINSPNLSAEASNALIESLYRAPVERHVLPNGLTLVHRPDFSSEVVSVQVWVKTGSIHEAAMMGSGLSHYLEHMLFKGTVRRNGKAISREVHAMGGSINAYTTFDRTVYYIDAPSSAFAQVVDVLADIVLHSTLPEAEVLKERDVILREIDMGLDDPDRQLSQALFRTAFQRHPYREPVIGHRDLYEQVTGDELRAYYNERYVPNNMVVSIVGAVAPEDCQREVNAAFGVVSRGRLAPVQIEVEPRQLASRREDIIGEYNISRGGLGFKVPNLSHPDSPKLDALAHALGGGESSVLWERLRNQRKLVHYIDCRNWNPGSEGLLWISYVCDPEKQGEVEAAILAEISAISVNGFAEDVVEKARRQALSAEINGRKTMSGQASRLGLGELVVGDINFGRRYLRRLNLVTPEDLQAVADSYLVDETMSCVTLGPELKPVSASEVADELSLSPFEVVRYESGARLLLQEDKRLPKVHIRCMMLGGPVYEPANQRGISELMAELLIKDTVKRSAEEISSLIESIGGRISATGGNNTISFSIEVLPTDLPIALELLGDALTCPIFEQSTFSIERNSQVAGLKEEDDEILDYGFRKLRERFFAEHPFGVGPSGCVADLEAITREDVVAHYKKLVCASNVVVSICGDFERKTLENAMEPLLNGRLPQMVFSKSSLAGFSGQCVTEDIQEPMDREQAVVLHGFPDVGVLHDDYVVGEVLNELFSGMSSRLFERIREDKGMAYYVGSSRIIGLETGMFVFYAGTHPSQAQEVVVEINNEIARVSAGEVSDEELERCRTRLKAARPMGRQTIGARAMHAAIQESYGLPTDDDAQHAAKLDAIDANELASFARQHLAEARGIRMIVGPIPAAE
ncbi:MAG TPA: insulinase family protein [Opitutae bacterium]|nr:insulinase family protein [Opitutae bacterium]